MATRNISVYVDYVGSYGRGVLQGVAMFLQAHTDWSLTTLPFYMFAHTPAFAELHTDGVVAAIGEKELLEQASGLRVPVVNVSALLRDVPFPSVVVNDEAVGRLGANFFLERGFRQFLFVGWPHCQFSVVRGKAFAATLEEKGCTCIDVNLQAGELPHALSTTPKPIAIMVCSDTAAIDVLRTCRQMGISVPEQVAVLGVDNDDLAVAVAQPMLASIEIPAKQIGYRAAELLAKMLDGEAPPERPVLLPPGNVITRTSVDLIAVGDADVAESLRFIREHGGEPIQVQDVLNHVALGRRTLERKFMAVLGRSPLDEIHRVHVERAKWLLADTDLSIAEIAIRSGFGDDTRFNVIFKRLAEKTPSAYRKELHLRERVK